MAIGQRRIEARGLVKIYRKRRVVEGVNLHVSQGEIVGLLGPNGAGKTTTFYMTVGLIKPNSGTILLDDKDVTKLPMYQRARLGIGYLAQEASIFRKLTARENVLLVLEATGYPAAKREARADELLIQLKMTHVANSKGFSLSGGERRRVEIARALATEPAFLLLDEPFAGIHPMAVLEIQEVIRDLRAMGLGILITDHNHLAMMRLCDRIYILAEGQVVTEGTAEVVANDPLARKVYLGEDFVL
jgi:lipopolysaccharide export system ATP-binding protein